MAFPQVTLVYKVPVVGMSTSALAAAVRAVPLPLDIFDALGIRVVSDNTVGGPPVVRTVVVSLAPSSFGSLSVTLDPETNGIASIDVTSAGEGYIASPVVFIEDGSIRSVNDLFNTRRRGGNAAAFLKVVGSDILAPGTGYSAQTTVGFVGGFPLGSAHMIPAGPPNAIVGGVKVGGIAPVMTTRNKDPFWFNAGVEEQTPDTELEAGYNCVGSVAVTDKGKGYNPATTIVEFIGQAPPFPNGLTNFIQAKGFATFDGKGHVTGVVVTNPGRGYVAAPVVVIVDSSGSEPNVSAKASVSMVRGDPAQATLTLDKSGAITAVNITNAGDGYVSPPTVVVFDPTGAGSGAVLSVRNHLGLSRVDVLASGSGYSPGTSVSAVPLPEWQFIRSLENGQNLTPLMFGNLMTARIRRAIAAPVFAVPPS